MKKNKSRGFLKMGIALVLSYTVYIVCHWSTEVFGVGLDQIIFTLTNPLKGADNSTFFTAVKVCLPRIIIFTLLFLGITYFIKKCVPFALIIKLKKRSLNIDVKKALKKLLAIISILSVIATLFYANFKYDFVEFIKNKIVTTQIYDQYYVDPQEVNIKLKEEGKYKNLIHIYLESMETTYTSKENGGVQEADYIPNLVKLANENITFSDKEGLGGFNCVDGTGYTMGALMATTAGIPYAFPVGANSMGERQRFASGLTNLGDILDKFGYNQEFLCGSDGNFAGRDIYFSQHGNYEVFDYHKAVEEGLIDKNHWVWWGYEDWHLYDIAKLRILEMAEKDQPFNYTMLTVDTHHIGGHICYYCKNQYNVPTANVISCADWQLGQFIEWCKEQDFYEDTVIVITGDHPRMDTFLVEGIDYNDRTIYNCFMNCSTQEDTVTKNRTFTSMDIFPTVLSAIGFEWDGDRLALGTNLFSSQQTLAEEVGLEYLNQEVSKNSKYYLKNFQ